MATKVFLILLVLYFSVTLNESKTVIDEVEDSWDELKDNVEKTYEEAFRNPMKNGFH